jgi:hypothetical protein
MKGGEVVARRSRRASGCQPNASLHSSTKDGALLISQCYPTSTWRNVSTLFPSMSVSSVYLFTSTSPSMCSRRKAYIESQQLRPRSTGGLPLPRSSRSHASSLSSFAKCSRRTGRLPSRSSCGKPRLLRWRSPIAIPLRAACSRATSTR